MKGEKYFYNFVWEAAGMIRIGIDVGGTDIKVGAVSREGELIGCLSAPTGADRPFEAVVADMAQGVGRLLKQMGLPRSEVSMIGLGLPGAVDPARGAAVNCTNLGWLDVPVRDEMNRYFDCPVLLENDANAAAIAENRVGASAGCRSSVMITLGTGVGSAILFGGKPWPGHHGMAGEIGHTVLVPGGLHCNCGRSGCAERYCSATALAAQGRQACLMYGDNGMLRMAGGDPSKITAKIVIDAAKAGDQAALAVFNDFARHLAAMVDTVISFIDPEIVVLGGGVSRAGNFLLDAVKANIPPCDMGQPRPLSRIELAALGNEAGMIGAAMLEP